MQKDIKTIRAAAEEWVGRFNAIPCSVVEKLLKNDIDSICEITLPDQNDNVYIFDGEHGGEQGRILRISDVDDEAYVIQIEGSDKEVEVRKENFELKKDGPLPMWGTMWTFENSCDEWWLEQKGLQVMSNCGFRIYESDDFGYIFGIDGAGYDFYEAHWIPLYKARGLQWHK